MVCGAKQPAESYANRFVLLNFVIDLMDTRTGAHQWFVAQSSPLKSILIIYLMDTILEPSVVRGAKQPSEIQVHQICYGHMNWSPLSNIHARLAVS